MDFKLCPRKATRMNSKPNDNIPVLIFCFILLLYFSALGYIAYRVYKEVRKKKEAVWDFNLPKGGSSDTMITTGMSKRNGADSWEMDTVLRSFEAPVTKPTATPRLTFKKSPVDSSVMFFDGEFIDEPTTPFLRIEPDSVNN